MAHVKSNYELSCEDFEMFGSTFQEHCDYEEGARYDYVKEMYGDHTDYEVEAEAAYAAECHEANIAAFGPYVDADIPLTSYPFPSDFDGECPF